MCAGTAEAECETDKKGERSPVREKRGSAGASTPGAATPKRIRFNPTVTVMPSPGGATPSARTLRHSSIPALSTTSVLFIETPFQRCQHPTRHPAANLCMIRSPELMGFEP